MAEDKQKKDIESGKESTAGDQKKEPVEKAKAKKETKSGAKKKTESPAKAEVAEKAEKKKAKSPAKAEEKPAKSVKKKPAAKKDKEAKKTGKKKAADKPAVEKKSGKAKKTEGTEYVPRLMLKYKNEVVPEMMKTFKYKNIMQVPKIEKIVLNVGMGKALQNSKLLDAAAEDLTIISGQKAIIVKAKRSVSNFKLRAGSPIGTKATLRKSYMYEFLDRFIAIAVPRIRDFRGLSDKSFDGFGNYSLGVKEQIIFPEIDYDKVESIHGMDICIVTTAKTDEEAKVMLRLLGMPFVEPETAA